MDLTCCRKKHAGNSKQSFWSAYRFAPCHLNYVTHVNKDGGSCQNALDNCLFWRNWHVYMVRSVPESFYWCHEIHVTLKTISAKGFEKQKWGSRNKCFFYDFEDFCVRPLLFLWIILVKFFIFSTGCYFLKMSGWIKEKAPKHQTR